MLLISSGWYLAFFGILFLSLIVLREWLQGAKCQSLARLHGKTVVITGANTGIGYETAKELSLRGAKIITGSRNLEKSQKSAKTITDLTGNPVTRKTFYCDFNQGICSSRLVITLQIGSQHVVRNMPV